MRCILYVGEGNLLSAVPDGGGGEVISSETYLENKKQNMF